VHVIVDGQIKSKRKTERQVAGDRWTISADRMVMGASQVVVPRPWTLDRASRRTASYLCSLQIRKDTPLESRWELSVPPSYPWLSYRVRILHFPASYAVGALQSIIVGHFSFYFSIFSFQENAKENLKDRKRALLMRSRVSPCIVNSHRGTGIARHLVDSYYRYLFNSSILY